MTEPLGHAPAQPAHDPPPDGSPLAATRVVLRPIASPFALGFLALAGATVVVSGLELRWIPAAEQHEAGLLVLVAAPGLQIVASVFGFLGRDPVAATGMGLLAGTWAGIGVVLATTPEGATSETLGMFLLLCTAAYLVTAATAAMSKLVPALVLATTGTRLCLTGVYELTSSGAWRHAAGYAGLVLAFAGLYAAASLELEGLRKRPVLPTLRHGDGSRALDADLAAQVKQVASEAGVRRQL